MKMKKYAKLIALTTTICISISYMGVKNLYIAKAEELKEGEALANKIETVYGLLNNDGSVENLSVINRIYNNEEKIVVDYGDYKEVASLDNKYKLEQKGSKISITSNKGISKSDVIVYEGKTTEDLPIDISLKYYLDGKEINPESLKGKSGNVKIEGKIVNNDDTPFMVQVGMNIDLNKFSNIKASDAIQVVSGNKLNLNYATFPSPEVTFTLEADVKEFELETISFNMVPKAPPIASLEQIIEPLQNMYNSIDQMTSNLPSGKIDTSKLNNAKKYEEGLNSIKTGSQEILNKTNELKKSLANIDINNDTSNMSIGLNKVSESSKNLNMGIENLDKSIEQIDGGVEALNQSLSNLSNNQNSIKQILNNMLIQDPDNKVFYESLIAQSNAIIDISNKVNQLDLQMDNLKSGSEVLVGGSEELSNALETISSQSNKIDEALTSIQTVLNVFNTYLDGVSNFSNGVLKFSNESKAIVDAIEQVSTIISKVNKLDTSKIDSSLKSLENTIDNLRAVEEESKENKEAVENYSSFMNNELNTNSKVSFIIKTEGIK